MLAAMQTPAKQTTQPTGPHLGADPGTDLAELYREHASQVFRAAYRITGNASDAEDVLQTVFMRLLKREEQVDLSAGAARYLHRAAVNAALDALRARKRRGAVDLEFADSELAAGPASDPHHRSGTREIARVLREAVGRLSPRAAEIFTLRYIEGHGNNEIADRLGTSATAVAVILHRTRHRLGRDLEPLLGGLPS